MHVLANNLVPYQYTGKYRESISGFSYMDARWYNSKVGRFIQPDQYNHANLILPKGAQSELMRYIGRTQNDLLKDPAQQMRYGYVSGNALRWVDPLGLYELLDDPNISSYGRERINGYVDGDISEIVDQAIEDTSIAEFFIGRAGKNVPKDERYVITSDGYVDLQHVVSSAYNVGTGFGAATLLGAALEVSQIIKYPDSAMNPEDFLSNAIGQQAAWNQMYGFGPIGSTVGDQVETLISCSSGVLF